MPKRRRTSSRSAPRPIDKGLINVTKSSVGASQVATTLASASYPCTVMGIRWNMAVIQDGGTGVSTGNWAIVHVEDGDAANTLAATDGGDFYTPEQSVLAFGVFKMDNNPLEGFHFEGTTKTMRKLKVGDSIQFITIGSATNTYDLRGVVQLFCKS